MQQWPVINRLLSLTILSGVIISLYGVAERMGIDKHLWVQDVQSRVFSSLGQPNWLAAYLVALMPIAMAFIIIKTQRLENHGDSQSITENRKFRFKFRISNFEFSIPTIYYLLTAGLFFFVLLSTRSRSGFFAFAAADLLFWAATLYTYLRNAVPIRPLKIPFLIVHATFAMIIFFNGSYIDTIDKYFTLDAWVQSTRNLSASSRQIKDSMTQHFSTSA